ncbi:MAG: Bax inhibitor-1/YccA family protein [Streptococcaceae bacterium]|jgi:FtsH-binding integral membrane protein|nr:Bax inhibitor-1/YccA family protein [Streptococcaceae bacterium]
MDKNNAIYSTEKSGLATFYNRVYAIMGMGVFVSAIVAYIMIEFFAQNMIAILRGGSLMFLLIWLIPMFLIFPMQRAAANNSPTALPMFIGFSVLLGFLVSFTLLMYTTGTIAVAFLTASGMFIGLSIFGRMTKRDLSGIGKAMVAALIGVIIASVINFFIASSALMYILSYVSVVIFSVLIAWDNQKIARVYEANNGQVQEGWAVSMALSLYLDFINLFLSLLRIFGGVKRS